MFMCYEVFRGINWRGRVLNRENTAFYNLLVFAYKNLCNTCSDVVHTRKKSLISSADNRETEPGITRFHDNRNQLLFELKKQTTI